MWKNLLTLLLFLNFSSCVVSDAPHVLLISIDGYRHDYTKKFNPPHIKKFISEGSSAEGLIPVFPTKTFPNHLSIITGVHPSEHGIVANKFYAPDLGKTYSLGDRDSVINKDFYSGLPFWNLVQKNGMKSATYFWPGSEAKINGMYPNYFMDYDGRIPNEERTKKVIEWFEKSSFNRPQFVTLYFSSVDSAGHNHGPNSKEVEEAVLNLDKILGTFFKELDKIKLNINVIIVSDHGMLDIAHDKLVILDNTLSSNEMKLLNKFKMIGYGPLIHFYKQEITNQEDIEEMVRILNRKSKGYTAYLRQDIPEIYHANNNPRIGDFIILADNRYTVGTKKSIRFIKGNHGFDQFKTNYMNGIFYAKGPQIKKGLTLKAFQNIHVYPLMAKLLGIELDHEIDGKINPVKAILK